MEDTTAHKLAIVGWGFTYLVSLIVFLIAFITDIVQRWGGPIILEWHVATVWWFGAAILAWLSRAVANALIEG